MTFIRSGGGLTVGYEVNFASLGTQDLTSGGDGSKTIDGKTWTATNTASATTFAITNGTGLVFESSTSADIFLLADPEELASDFDVNKHWRMWTRYTLTANQNFENSHFLMTSEPATARLLGTLRGNNSVFGGDRYFNYTGNSTTDEYSNPGAYSGHNLLLIEYLNGGWRFSAGTQTTGAATDSLTTSESELIVLNQGTVAGDITANPFVNGAMRWRYGISTSVTSNNLTVEAMRLEIQGS